MEKINILIVEDEPIITRDISSSLRALGYGISGIARSADEALRVMLLNKPDLILLDIAIEGSIDGIELAKQIKEICGSPYIFLTSYADKATIERVVQTEPAAYIVKPFDDQDLLTNIELALYKSAHRKPEQPRQVDIEKEFRQTDEFFVKVKGELTKVGIGDILWVEAYDNYSYIKTASAKYLISSTLKNIEGKFASKGFVRIHRSYLINMSKIIAIREDNVIIENQKVPIGRKYRGNLKQRISLL